MVVQPFLELLDFPPQIIDDVLVLADVEGDQFLICQRFSLDVLGSLLF